MKTEKVNLRTNFTILFTKKYNKMILLSTDDFIILPSFYIIVELNDVLVNKW